MTSAESRLAAASNEIRVRVLSSKNRLTTVRPRSAGSFLIGRSASERISSAVAEDQLGVRAGQVGRAQQVPLHRAPRARPGGGAPGVPEIVTASSPSNSASRTADRLDQGGGQVLADEVGADRQLAVAAVDQHREPDGPRAADVVHRVERGADRAAGEQHVVDEHDDLAVDAAVRDLGGQQGAGRPHPQVVAVHRHVERADGDVDALDGGDLGGDALGERDAAASGCRAAPGRRRPCCARGSRARCGSGPGRRRAGPSPRGRSGAGRMLRRHWLAGTSSRTSFSASQDGSLKDVDRASR